MSAFDDNPFDNEPTVDNPFADPSVQQMTKKPTNIQQGLDDYNPFADPTSQQRAGTVRGAANPPPQYAPGAGPAVMAPTSQDVSNTLPPAYNKSSQQIQAPTLTTSELQRRQEELDRKAAELERREQELRRNEVNVRRNNWPPLPDNCCWQPCFYLDINVEIQPEFQKIVTQLYKLWQFHAALLLANVFGTVWLNLVGLDITDFFLSIVYSAVFIPLSFLCWFRPGYKAFRDDSSFNFMVFFFIFFFQMVLSLMQGLGFSGGYCGLLKAFPLLDGGTTKRVLVGIIILCIALGFLAAAAADLYLISKIHRIYRSSGASFSKAQAEFAEGFFRNEHVRGAAANVAQAAVRQQFAAQSQQPPSNRY
ncbi:secretory carrier-associated membrane protein 1 [Planococcus citri]|uniref:secretory carrier-associated membrane protein 1 n=1 Tax=Planococcus citri TaxID=170843 RepID=UPI0031F9222D